MLKYLIVADGPHEHAILFPEIVAHKEIGGAAGHKLVAAGFCSIDTVDGNVTTWGKSDSLGVEGRPEDHLIISKSLGRIEGGEFYTEMKKLRPDV